MFTLCKSSVALVPWFYPELLINPPVFSPPGHGECHCGECKCHAGYVGDNCNCSTEMSSCISNDGQMCSGRGSCVCGRCQCTEPGSFGDACEKCPTCPDACGTKRSAVPALTVQRCLSVLRNSGQSLVCLTTVILQFSFHFNYDIFWLLSYYTL